MKFLYEILFIMIVVLVIIGSLLSIRREWNDNINKIKIENKGYFVLLSSGHNYYLTDEQFLELQEEIKLNNKTYTFVNKAREEAGKQVEKEEVYTIFIDKIVHIYRERKIEN